MTVVLIGLALAVAASVAQGAGYLCQHLTAAERPPVSARRPLRTLASMLRSPWWRVGLALGGAGFLLHLAALALAPISLVQAFVAGGLALVVPLAGRAFRHELTTTEKRAVPLMAGSLAALALGISEPAKQLSFDAGTLGLYLAGLTLLAALLATAVGGPLRHPALGLSAGLFYGALDSSTKGLADLARGGGPSEVLRSPLLLVAVVTAIAAFFCFQRALQTNRPLTAIAMMEAGATGGGVLAGFVAFGDPLGATPAVALLHLAAFIGVGVAVWNLAPAQARLVSSAGAAGMAPAGLGRGAGTVEPPPGVLEGAGHLGTPQPPVVYSRGLRGPDGDSQAT